MSIVFAAPDENVLPLLAVADEERTFADPPFAGDPAVSVVSKVGDRVTPSSKVEFIMGTFIGV